MHVGSDINISDDGSVLVADDNMFVFGTVSGSSSSSSILDGIDGTILDECGSNGSTMRNNDIGGDMTISDDGSVLDADDMSVGDTVSGSSSSTLDGVSGTILDESGSSGSTICNDDVGGDMTISDDESVLDVDDNMSVGGTVSCSSSSIALGGDGTVLDECGGSRRYGSDTIIDMGDE